MNYKIYIQSLNNFPIADWAVSAYMGFKEKQADIIFFENIEEVPVSKNNIVVAFIEETNKYFDKFEMQPIMALNIPTELSKFAERMIFNTTMGDILSREALYPLFIKPGGKAKQFVAGVVKNTTDAKIYFKDVALDCPVFVSDVVEFISEYRGYIIDGQLKGLKHYIGDFRIFPDTSIIDAAVEAYKGAPAGYAIDFGITEQRETILVECNDGWSLGNYGLNDVTYSTLLAKRWIQIMRDGK